MNVPYRTNVTRLGPEYYVPKMMEKPT